jgi:F-type H+-transporting ATPase subunit b
MEVILPKDMLLEVIVALVSFLVLFGVLSKFAFPSIIKMLDLRSDTIRESLEKSEETRVEAERLLDEYKVQMTEARHEAAKVIEQGRKVAETMKDEVIAKAHDEAAAILVKAREEIGAEKRAAMAELQASVADLSVAVASKLIGTSLSDAEHRKLIESYVAEVGSLNGN